MAAPTEARFGTMEFGLFRFGYYTWINAVVTIAGIVQSLDPILSENGVPTLRITQSLNDEPDTCSFTVRPAAVAGGLSPVAGQTLQVGFGCSTNLEFGGQITRVAKRFVRGVANPYIDIFAQDWARLLDRRLVNNEWTSVSASAIASDLIDNYTSGFTRSAVVGGLPTIDYFPCTNETVSGALRRLANLIGGGFYVDAYKNLHFFGPAGDTTSYAGTNPTAVAAGLTSWHSFGYTADFTQLRTRVYVEGKQTTCPISLPAGLASGSSIPIVDAGQIDVGPGLIKMGTVRIGYTSAGGPSLAGGTNPPGAVTTADAAPGDTSIHTDSSAAFSATNTKWVKVADQIVKWGSIFVTGIQDIPASGFGSIQATIPAGTQITVLGALAITQDIPRAIAKDTAVVQVTQVDDATNQTNVAAVEGGDGIHETVIADGRLSVAGAQDEGQADLTRYAASTGIIDAEILTDDLNAIPGRQYGINYGGLVTTLLITESELSFPTPNGKPWRRVRASSLRQPGLMDRVVTQAN